jgi:hypothetical protein
MAKKSTALATADEPLNGNFLALIEGSAELEAMETNLGDNAVLTESDLRRVKIPSAGGTKWTIPSVTGDETVDEIEGILAAVCPRGILWPSIESREGTMPLLRSDDLKIAHRVGNDNGDISPAILEKYRIGDGEPAAYDWQGLTSDGGPFGFGSGKNGQGKRAKEQRVLFILRERDVFPLVVTASPGSLKAIRQFVLGLVNAGIPHYRAIIGLSLRRETSQGGQAYSQIVPRLIGTLTVEQGEAIRQKYTIKLKEVARKLPVETAAD